MSGSLPRHAFRESRLAVHLVLTTVAVLFSANYILMKVALAGLDALALAWLRVAGSALLLGAIYVRHRTPLVPFTGREKRALLLYALLGVVFNQLLFIGGLARTTAQHAAILIVTIPVFALLVAIALGHERASAARAAGIFLAAAGAIAIPLRSGVGPGGGSLGGDVMIILNSFSYATYLVLSKPMMSRHSSVRVITALFVAGAFLIPFSARSLAAVAWRQVPPGAWVALLLVIAGPTVGAYLLNGWALARAETSVVAAYTYLQPLLASLLAATFLGEQLSAPVAAAALLIIAGVWLAGRQSRRTPPENVNVSRVPDVE